LERKIADARAHLERGYSDERAARVERAMLARRRRRRIVRTVGAALAMVLAGLGGARLVLHRASPWGEGGTGGGLDGRELRGRPGGAELARGAVRVEVAPLDARLFRVQVSGVSIEAGAAELLVERTTLDVRVEVIHGRARVASPAGAVELAAG